MFMREYHIDFVRALEECKRSPQFLAELNSGLFIFVDSCFCLNHPDYVIRNENGVIKLTDYARDHLSKCCLPLTTSFVDYGVDYYVDYDWDYDNDFGVSYAERDFSDDDWRINQQIEYFTHIKDEILAVAKSLPIGFSGTLDALIKWRGMTEEELAEASALSVKTIQRLRRYEPNGDVSLETVIQLCIGLQLHPILSDYMLRAAGRDFMPTNLHIAYQLLISTCYNYTIDECNILLKSQRLPTLGRKSKK